MTHIHKLVVQFLNTCHILINYLIVTWKIAHKVQLHLDWYVWMNMCINIVYTYCIGNVTCN
jgi:hypothetical protein